MRTSQRPPWARASAYDANAVSSEPMWSNPVGLGANRPMYMMIIVLLKFWIFSYFIPYPVGAGTHCRIASSRQLRHKFTTNAQFAANVQAGLVVGKRVFGYGKPQACAAIFTAAS